MALLHTVIDLVADEISHICPDHLRDSHNNPELMVGPCYDQDGSCAECEESDPYDDGDYPGVEMDENMSRIEGDDFWYDSGCGEDY